jgi:hypothetical protein
MILYDSIRLVNGLSSDRASQVTSAKLKVTFFVLFKSYRWKSIMIRSSAVNERFIKREESIDAIEADNRHKFCRFSDRFGG